MKLTITIEALRELLRGVAQGAFDKGYAFHAFDRHYTESLHSASNIAATEYADRLIQQIEEGGRLSEMLVREPTPDYEERRKQFYRAFQSYEFAFNAWIAIQVGKGTPNEGDEHETEYYRCMEAYLDRKYELLQIMREP